MAPKTVFDSSLPQVKLLLLVLLFHHLNQPPLLCSASLKIPALFLHCDQWHLPVDTKTWSILRTIDNSCKETNIWNICWTLVMLSTAIVNNMTKVCFKLMQIKPTLKQLLCLFLKYKYTYSTVLRKRNANQFRQISKHFSTSWWKRVKFIYQIKLSEI